MTGRHKQKGATADGQAIYVAPLMVATAYRLVLGFCGTDSGENLLTFTVKLNEDFAADEFH
jgi:hypothetical protein